MELLNCSPQWTMVWMKPRMSAAPLKRVQKRGSPPCPTNACSGDYRSNRLRKEA